LSTSLAKWRSSAWGSWIASLICLQISDSKIHLQLPRLNWINSLAPRIRQSQGVGRRAQGYSMKAANSLHGVLLLTSFVPVMPAMVRSGRGGFLLQLVSRANFNEGNWGLQARIGTVTLTHHTITRLLQNSKDIAIAVNQPTAASSVNLTHRQDQDQTEDSVEK
jgi:hypothetical protein